MRFKRHSKLEVGLKQIDIAPLMDIMFLLLIFFMLSSTFTSQTGIHVKLPKAVTSDAVKDENLIVTVTGENVIYFNGEIITLKELENKLKKISNTNQALLIKADQRASVGRIVDVWDLCRELGIERVNIATTTGT